MLRRDLLKGFLGGLGLIPITPEKDFADYSRWNDIQEHAQKTSYGSEEYNGYTESIRCSGNITNLHESLVYLDKLIPENIFRV